MRTLTQADREIAAGVARARRLNAGDVTKATPVRMLGADARFSGNDESDEDGDSTRILSHSARMRQHEEARDAIRLAGIRTESELLALLQCIHANTGAFALERKEALLEVCADLDSDINALPQPELLEYGNERGEFDSRTAGVKGRA